jgi:NAD(P)-dependent dehydrogenase (short-subunit alcohol dehydrogenase family)
MKELAGRIAVVTGGGTGMGRELVRQLVAEGCNVAMCDVFAEAMAETKRL